MTKTASKTAETIEFPTFDASQATDQFRAFTEKGMEQSKEAYAKIKTNAEEAQKLIEATYENAKAATAELTLKSVAAMRANTEAGLSHVEALVGVKSLSEFMELQTAFVRKSTEMMLAQAKDMQALSTRTAEDMAKPMKSTFEKSLKELQAA